MKKSSNKSKLNFNCATIIELNDSQLKQIYGADLVEAVKSAVVSFTQNTNNTNFAIVQAAVNFTQTIQQP